MGISLLSNLSAALYFVITEISCHEAMSSTPYALGILIFALTRSSRSSRLPPSCGWRFLYSTLLAGRCVWLLQAGTYRCEPSPHLFFSPRLRLTLRIWSCGKHIGSPDRPDSCGSYKAPKG